jgi:septum formation protein
MSLPEELLARPANRARLYLASASPRRRELLTLLGVRFLVVVSRFNEESLSHLTDPVEYVLRAAEGKAGEVASRRAGVILGVDTDVVSPDGEILGKPTDPEDAKRLLRLLSGRTHRVHTGIALLESDGRGTVLRREVRSVETAVTFAPLAEEAIAAYVATGDPLDKAGAYGFQGGALAFISRIEGDPSSVIGLPLWPLTEMLRDFGVALWGGPGDAPGRSDGDDGEEAS